MLTMLIEIGWFHQGAWRGEKILVGSFETGGIRSVWLSTFWRELEKLNCQLELNNRERIGVNVEFDAKATDRLHVHTAEPDVIVKRIEQFYAATKVT